MQCKGSTPCVNCDITGDLLRENPVKFQSGDFKHIHYLLYSVTHVYFQTKVYETLLNILRKEIKNQETNQPPVLFMVSVRIPSFLVNVGALEVGEVES